MVRERVIDVALRYYQNRLPINEAVDFLREYCIERGKTDMEKLELFLTFSCASGLIDQLMDYAIDWYRRKHTLFMIYKMEPGIINRKVVVAIY